MHTSPAVIPFQPRLAIRNPHVQSILASSNWMLPGVDKRLMAMSREWVIDTPSGTRLLALLSQHPKPRGIMIVLHGWEGSAMSAYAVAAGAFFYRAGFTVVRLNLRDHGPSHHLNQGLFHGALIEETFEAISCIAARHPDIPVFLMGFSLGANFALRIALKHAQQPIGNLRHVFAVSPPLDPHLTTQAIDAAPAFYRKYFLRKWKRSLSIKQKLFPDRYDFTDMMDAKTCMDLTDRLMAFFPEFLSFRDYFKLYTLSDDLFKSLRVPVGVFIAEDDPVIPASDVLRLSQNNHLKLYPFSGGGHCGFLDLIPYRRLYHDIILQSVDLSVGRMA